jgi:urease accessory protein
MPRIVFVALALALPTLSAEPALAHLGYGVDPSFVQGFIHPFRGLDHVLAAASVGFLAFFLSGRALWALPVTYVAVLLVGGVAGLSGFEGPAIEHGIAASVLLLGPLIALAARLPLVSAVPLIALFAIFHGAAHSSEGAITGSAAVAAAYFAGFLLATPSLIGGGILLAKALSNWERLAQRVAGASVGLAGVLMFVA